ncbi:hypothetical protein FF38_01337 [Lucilia cuprina]|uniref:Uncharacterized protein n=1 Tax=Lucilia cuprina TaxID=7375 RepID=A0A0L0BTD9_LUCCU|nr:hypothetical protein FF38_01337 [Lucilia cuprina]
MWFYNVGLISSCVSTTGKNEGHSELGSLSHVGPCHHRSLHIKSFAVRPRDPKSAGLSLEET